MKRQLIGLLVGLCTFATACLGVPVLAYHVGRIEAYFDLRQGRRQFKRCINWHVEARAVKSYDRMLNEKFGAKTVVVPPCSYYLEHQPSGERVYGYNSVQVEEIDRLFGEGAFEKARGEFAREYTRQVEEEYSRRDAVR